jgi:hypothetical protein
MILVKRHVADHGCVRWQARAVDGRRHKKRRAHKLGDMIVKVRNTKKERPIPVDVIELQLRNRVRSFCASPHGGLCSTKVVLNRG